MGAFALAALAGTAMADIEVGAPGLKASYSLSDTGAFSERTITAGARYSNVTTFTGSYYAHGFAAGTTRLTAVAGDDISMTAALNTGNGCTYFEWSTVNANATAAVTARMRVRFYQMDGTGGAPGTYITGFSFAATALAANSVNLWYYNPAAGTVNLPQNFWACLTFDTSGGTGTLAQMNNIGQAIFTPPDVGSSQDAFFAGNASSDGLVNNPPGTVSWFGGTPTANFGWEFAPAPSSIALLGLGGLVAGRRRR